MKGVIKSIGKNDGVRAVLFFVMSLYIRLVHLTSRWTVIGGEHPQPFWDENKPFILAFWHNRIMMMPYSWPNPASHPVSMMASSHRDGQFVVRTMNYFGIGSVTGSASKGGARALLAQLKLIKQGQWVGITPDGPRGPRMRAKPGIIALAKKAGVPIIPVAYSTSKRKVAKGWDRFIIPRPFSQGVFVWGAPIDVSKDGDDEAYRQHVEEAMTTAANEADRACGHAPIEAEAAS